MTLTYKICKKQIFLLTFIIFLYKIFICVGDFMKMESIVHECLSKHKGGDIFFDNLDEKLRNDESLMWIMINKVLENINFDYIIVSGKFGYAFQNFCQKNNFYQNFISVNGSLRKNDIINKLNIDIYNKKIIFVDDSFYLGRTRDKIKNFIESYGANLISTYVFYDGSKIKDINVNSFYRYYDNYK